jgi:uncharacterized lipoprotein YddW (UPF0748 family)
MSCLDCARHDIAFIFLIWALERFNLQHRHFFSAAFLFILLCIPFLLSAQIPKHEVRAVWISTASGDWPSSTKRDEQQRSLIEIFETVKNHNLNTIFFQVRPRGNTYYRSEIEPWASHLTGTTGKDPGWDPLQFAISEAHKRGLELHAWFNVAKVWGLDTPPKDPKHLLQKHREWVQQVEGEWWIDPGIPEAREYTVRLIRELAENYDIDGIHFDFIRYPDERFDDRNSYRQWSDGEERDDWRRNNITSFVQQSYYSVKSIAPWIKVGSAPIGIYREINGAQSSFNGFSGVYQDSRLWLRNGIHDYIVPQIYWSLGVQSDPYDPDFYLLAHDWTAERYGRHVYAGIGIYRDHIRPETKDQIAVARNSGMKGAAFFRYGYLSEISEHLRRSYPTPALIPAMQWLDSVPPHPPVDIIVRQNGTDGTVIQWKSDPRDAERPYRYAVYRSRFPSVDTRSARNLLTIVPGSQTTFTDRTANESTEGYFYSVTALDRLWNESVTAEQQAEIMTMHTRFTVPSGALVVSQHYPEPFTQTAFIAFSLPQKDTVTIRLIHAESGKESIVVNGLKQQGEHIIALPAGEFPSGMIEYEFRAGERIVTRSMTKK